MGKTGDWIKDENGYIRYVHYKDVLTIDDYEGVNRITYHFQGKEYILCCFEHGLEALTPEEYSNTFADGDWCSLGVIDVKSKPIIPNIYPYDMLTFVWDKNHEYMYPTELEHLCFYDLKTTDICHIDLKSLDEYLNNNLHILLLTKFIKPK